MNTKLCPVCNCEKPLSDFSKNARRCRKCNYALVVKWRLENPEKFKAQQLRSRKVATNSKLHAEYKQPTPKVSVPYKDNHNAYMAEYRKRPEVRERVNAAARAKRAASEEERGRNVAAVNARRALKKSRTRIDVELTNFAYSEAVSLARKRTEHTGFGWDVDHVVPLKSNLVCGLHCWTNFAVVPLAVNRSKGNRTWPDKA